MSTTPADLLASLRWRYATKQFDPARTIPADLWEALRQVLILSPSSYGLQPWRCLVIEDPALRKQLRAVSYNQSQVTDAARFVVFTARTTITEADADRLIAATSATRGVPVENLAGYRSAIVGDLVKGPRSAWSAEWAARQAYIGLGLLLTAAAELGVDACPMEGFDPAAYDRILGLEGSGYRAVVITALGYRSAGDKYAAAAKVRFPAEEILEVR